MKIYYVLGLIDFLSGRLLKGKLFQYLIQVKRMILLSAPALLSRWFWFHLLRAEETSALTTTQITYRL